MQVPNIVEIVEVGPRDGLQNEAVIVPTEKSWPLRMGFSMITSA